MILLILFTIFVITGTVAMVIGLVNSKDYDIAVFAVVGFGIIATGVFIKSQKLALIDVHNDKISLEITYKDDVIIDSTVVSK